MLGTIKCMVICGLVAAVCGQAPSVLVMPMDEIFFHCLCEAVEAPCNHNRGCSSGTNVLCGPFDISDLYWKDGGEHKVQEDNSRNREKLAYQICALDLACAAKTVEGYMKDTRIKDCNKDGVIDSMDYALTHRLGGYTADCSYDYIVANNDTGSKAFIDKFVKCKQSFTPALF